MSQTRKIEVFGGPSGSWTMLTSSPRGVNCVLESGENWRPVATLQHEPAKSASEAQPIVDWDPSDDLVHP